MRVKSHMKHITIALVLAGALVTGTAYADFTTTQWKFKKDIAGITTSQSGAYVKVFLDKEVNFHAKPDLSDVRVLEDGLEAPYQLVTLNESVRSDYIQSTLHDISSRDGKTLFTIDLGAKGVMNDHLRIVTDSKNFKKSVSVYAADSALSVDDTKWRLLTDHGYIYNFHDATSGFDAGSGEVVYPETSSRYLKVIIGGGEGERVSVSSVAVYRISTRESVENQIRVTPTVTDNQVKKTTEITLDLGGSGIPTHRVTLATTDTKNFSRRALILSSDDAVNWSSVGDGYVFSLDTPLFKGQALALPYREVRSRYIRVLVMNQDDPAVTWSSQANVESTVRAVVFSVVAGKSYALYYGNSAAIAPSYDFARYFQYIESTVLEKASLATEEMNEGYTPPTPPIVPYSETHPNILNGVLVLLVALLSFFMIAHLKKLKHMERGENV